jgi:PAS domain S-box-containing protein
MNIDYKNITQTLFHMVWETDHEGNFLHDTKNLKRWTRDGFRELKKGVWVNVIRQGKLLKIKDLWQEAVVKGKSLTTEFRVSKKNGLNSWFYGKSMPFIHKQGKVVTWVGAGINIDRLKQMEERLANSEKQYQLLAESMPQIVWTANATGEVDYYNQRFADYTGLPVYKGHNWGWKPVIHAEDRKKTLSAWRRAVKRGSLYEMEHRIQRADGAFRWWLSRGVPYKDHTGKVIKWFGTATDIHEQKLNEARLNELSSQLMSIVEGTDDAIAIKEYLWSLFVG